MASELVRPDYKFIEEIIHPGARVIDLGCGEGELIYHLENAKNTEVQGIELDEKAIYKCVEKGLSVLHSNLDDGLTGFPDKSFDYVILNQSLQQLKRVEYVLQEGFRVGSKLIVGLPNFANLAARIKLFFKGEAPVTSALPYQWFGTPNLRFLSIKDFKGFCRSRNIKIEREYYLGKSTQISFLPNIFAQNAVFVLSIAGQYKSG